jgi:hypothetical protein
MQSSFQLKVSPNQRRIGSGNFSGYAIDERVPASAIAFLAFGLNDGTAGVFHTFVHSNDRHCFHMYYLSHVVD